MIYLNVAFCTEGSGFEERPLVCDNSRINVHASSNIIKGIYDHILLPEESVGVDRFGLGANLHKINKFDFIVNFLLYLSEFQH